MPLDRVAIPYVSGRFNYMHVGEDTAHVLFSPFKDNTAIYIARNIPTKEAIDLAEVLNKELKETRYNIRELQKQKFRELDEVRRTRRELREKNLLTNDEFDDEFDDNSGSMYE